MADSPVTIVGTIARRPKHIPGSHAVILVVGGCYCCSGDPYHPIDAVVSNTQAGIHRIGIVAFLVRFCTRMGRMLDALADLALLTFLAIGLYSAGVIPRLLLWLLIVRYPLLLIAVLIMSFARGPASMRPSFFGKATTFATSVVLFAVAFKTLLSASWPTPLLIEWSFRILYFLVSANVLYLVYRGVKWAATKQNYNSGNL